MGRVAASATAAQVIRFEAVGHWAYESFVDDVVDEAAKALADGDDAVAVLKAPGEDPAVSDHAGRRRRMDYAAQGAFVGWQHVAKIARCRLCAWMLTCRLGT